MIDPRIIENTEDLNELRVLGVISAELTHILITAGITTRREFLSKRMNELRSINGMTIELLEECETLRVFY